MTENETPVAEEKAVEAAEAEIVETAAEPRTPADPPVKSIKVTEVINKCGADRLVPLLLTYMFYVILHGHLSPGGGFQGGVLMVAVVVLFVIGYGYKDTVNLLSFHMMKDLQGLALILYVAIAFAGVAFGAKFCSNVFFNNGNIGDLISSGTISWMDEAVGINVLTGVVIISVLMLGVLMAGSGDDDSGSGKE